MRGLRSEKLAYNYFNSVGNRLIEFTARRQMNHWVKDNIFNPDRLQYPHSHNIDLTFYIITYSDRHLYIKVPITGKSLVPR